jgi:hypothetical protein
LLVVVQLPLLPVLLLPLLPVLLLPVLLLLLNSTHPQLSMNSTYGGSRVFVHVKKA